MAVSQLSSGRSEQVTIGKIPVAALIGGGIGAVANLILYFVVQALGVTLDVVMGPAGSPAMPMPFAAPIISTLVGAVGGAIVFALLARFTKRPRTIFLIVAGVFLVLSMFPAVTMPVPGSVQLTLAVMHVIAGAAIVWALLTRTA